MGSIVLKLLFTLGLRPKIGAERLEDVGGAPAGCGRHGIGTAGTAGTAGMAGEAGGWQAGTAGRHGRHGRQASGRHIGRHGRRLLWSYLSPPSGDSLAPYFTDTLITSTSPQHISRSFSTGVGAH